MAQIPQQKRQQRVYRIDRFLVPDAARTAFLTRVNETHELLRLQSGFLQDFLLEEEAGPDTVSIITFVEWENQPAIDNARRVVSAMHERIGFDPKAMLAEWGVRVEMGTLHPVESGYEVDAPSLPVHADA